MTTRRVVVVGAARSAIGKFGGSLKDISTVDLGATVVKAAVERATINPSAVDHVFMGNVIHTDLRDMYLARAITINAGLSVETPALSLNRVCGSGLQAIISAAQAILLGDIDVAVAGGVESMSRAPYWLPTMRWGQRMQDGAVLDVMLGAVTDPFDGCAMGMTAERVATRYGITREMQDQLALNSQLRAAAAIEAGYFANQIVPIDVPVKGGTTPFAVDEGVRGESTLAGLAKLRPIFDAQGSVTAGNSSSINDGAAALVLMDEQVARAHGLPILAQLVGYSHAGVDPAYMGIGPIPAIQKVLAKTGIRRDDVAIYEINEAFSVVAEKFIRDLKLDREKVNINGGAMALGHPIGATGSILIGTCLDELERSGGRYGLVTMCAAGGMAPAIIIERI
jgi:acetyl-CoA C-acetyltransferase